MRRTPFATLAVVSCLALATASLARAAWVPDGTPLWPGHATDSYPYTAPDGMGGFLIGLTANSDTTFFRFGADGSLLPGWPRRKPAGLGFTSVTPLAADGAGGAYYAATMTYVDPEVRVFHLRPDGEHDPAFGPDGVLLCDAPGPKYPTIGSDGDGGAIVTWTDSRNSSPAREIYGSRVTPLGLLSPGWFSNGTLLVSVAAPKSLAIGMPLPDQAGGTFQNIELVEFSFPTQTRLPRWLHYDGAGQTVAGWPAQGLASPGGGNQGFGMEPDGSGGAYLAWNDGFAGMILHVTPSGAAWPGWPGGGIDLRENPKTDQRFVSATLSDGAGGVYIATQGLTTYGDPYSLTLLRMDANGAPHAGWELAGTVLPPTTYTGLAVSAVHGAGGSCVLLYGEYAQDATLGYHVADLHTARVEPGGDVFTLGAWSAGEIPVCTAPGGRYDPRLVEAPGGAVFAVWRDSRGAPTYSPYGTSTLYAMRIHPDGGVSTGVAPGVSGDAPLSLAPNPARGRTEVRFAMRERASVEVAVFDVTGRLVRTLASETREAGDQRIAWDGRDALGRMTPPGVYLVRAMIAGRASEARLVRLD